MDLHGIFPYMEKRPQEKQDSGATLSCFLQCCLLRKGKILRDPCILWKGVLE